MYVHMSTSSVDFFWLYICFSTINRMFFSDTYVLFVFRVSLLFFFQKLRFYSKTCTLKDYFPASLNETYLMFLNPISRKWIVMYIKIFLKYNKAYTGTFFGISPLLLSFMPLRNKGKHKDRLTTGVGRRRQSPVLQNLFMNSVTAVSPPFVHWICKNMTGLLGVTLELDL